MAELPTRPEICGADMRKMDRIGMRLDKTIERIAKLEQRFELLANNFSNTNEGFLDQIIGNKKNGKKKKTQ